MIPNRVHVTLLARWLGQWLGRGALLLALLFGSYATAGLIGGAIPANAQWRPPAQGVRIYVESNGIHVGIVVPKVAGGVDWRGLAPGADLADPRYAGYDHLAIGWGERAFFLDTATWADLKLRTVLSAARGSDATLMHVEHVPAPHPGVDVRSVVLRPEEYRRLAGYIRASLADPRQRYRGYDANDAFYAARGHYDAMRTCNAWAGAALRHAGVRVGRWTPFPVTVLAWF
ncbi:uncharacterized protein (TIGR02117 family) [Sphingomonas insulae]|uniref:TIGR02117 family protein n=1 Tax=Sphingomonas insulae TaxID=424800 RepID=A0ABN1HTJ6_9SPHN|nr:TIGR02117 family protein [Sphingomonas insulae]NIJ28124.1 uncharacterized protein (TIGR02117 family) [Sphingomonas insulae]